MLLLVLLLLTHFRERDAYRVGSWTRYIPLADSNESALSPTFDVDGTIELLKEENQTMFGLNAASCDSTFSSFVRRASELYPELNVFAAVSSHASLSEYCDSYLNDDRTDVNFTRLGETIASIPNVTGVYIDDFYVMMCRVGRVSYTRRGSTTQLPCVPMSEVENMLRVMQDVNPEIEFLPLVYHSQFPLALPNGYAIGAPYGIPFETEDNASVLFPILSHDLDETSTYTLRFFYESTLQGNTHEADASFTVSIDSKPVFQHNASSGTSLQMFESNIDIMNDAKELRFTLKPLGPVISPSVNFIHAERLMFISGVQLVNAKGQKMLNHSNLQFEANGNEIIAQSTNESVLSSNAVIAMQSQDPNAFDKHAYTEAMRMMMQQNYSVYSGHYARQGLNWSIPISTKELSQAIELDRNALQLKGSLIWNIAMSVSRCRSDYDESCDRGIFTQRRLTDTNNMFLVWPDKHLCLMGWYSRYHTTVFKNTEMLISLHDSQRAKGNKSIGIFSSQMFSKRIYGMTTGTIYFENFVGFNGTGSKSIVPCPGASDFVSCNMTSDSSLETLSFRTLHDEEIVIELSIQNGCAQTPVVLTIQNTSIVTSSHSTKDKVQLPLQWKFDSGLRDDDGTGQISIREVYNVSIDALNGRYL